MKHEAGSEPMRIGQNRKLLLHGGGDGGKHKVGEARIADGGWFCLRERPEHGCRQVVVDHCREVVAGQRACRASSF